MQPYDARLFLDRESEIGLVEGRARQLLEGAVGIPRVIAFHNERMSGKTWLATHLKRTTLRKMPGVKPVLLNFVPSYPPGSYPSDEWYAQSDLKELDETEAVEMADRIVRWVADQVEASAPEKAGREELARYLARDVERKYKTGLFVLILDSLFEANWNLLGELEKYLLDPLARLSRVLIVMTGRGRIYPWKSAYLGGELESLKPLNKKAVKELFQRAGAESSFDFEEAFALSDGNPGVIVLLSQNGARLHLLDKAANYLLDVLPPTRPERDRYELRQYFEALCVLEGFRDDILPGMLQAYSDISAYSIQYFDNSTYSKWDNEKRNKELSLLIETHLVHWEKGRYVIDGSIQRILRAYLKQGNPSLWRRLHKRAYEIYLRWSEQYPKQTLHFQKLAQEHEQALHDGGIGVIAPTAEARQMQTASESLSLPV